MDKQSIYSQVCQKYGVTLFRVPQSDPDYKFYINASAIFGLDFLKLGVYEDEELEIISFFHEIGHVIASEINTYEAEKNAWKYGIEEAKRYGIFFSENALRWADEQLETYEK